MSSTVWVTTCEMNDPFSWCLIACWTSGENKVDCAHLSTFFNKWENKLKARINSLGPALSRAFHSLSDPRDWNSMISAKKRLLLDSFWLKMIVSLNLFLLLQSKTASHKFYKLLNTNLCTSQIRHSYHIFSHNGLIPQWNFSTLFASRCIARFWLKMS